MRSPYLLCLSLALGAMAETPQEGYKRLCDNPSSEPVAVDDSMTVTYHCNQYAPTANKYTLADADTPEDCIKLCADQDCPGAAWNSRRSMRKPCLLATHSILTSLAPRDDSVFMTYEKQDNWGSNEDSGQDLWGADDCPECICPASQGAQCTRDDGKLRIVGNKVYRIFCEKNHQPTAYKQVPNVPNLQVCLEECTKEKTKCIAGDYNRAAKMCNLKDRDNHGSQIKPRAGIAAWLYMGDI